MRHHEIIKELYPSIHPMVNTGTPVIEGVRYDSDAESLILSTWDRHYRCIVRKVPLSASLDEIRKKVKTVQGISDEAAVERRMTPEMRKYLEDNLYN